MVTKLATLLIPNWGYKKRSLSSIAVIKLMNRQQFLKNVLTQRILLYFRDFLTLFFDILLFYYFIFCMWQQVISKCFKFTFLMSENYIFGNVLIYWLKLCKNFFHQEKLKKLHCCHGNDNFYINIVCGVQLSNSNILLRK